MPIMKRFLGSDEGLELKVKLYNTRKSIVIQYRSFQILKRGAKPNGGGEILFRCPTKMKLRPCQWTDAGKIKRIRGVA